ncbi:MAG TPA: hypothetical protein PLX03_02605, partial [Candidatus Hydrogenedentes bacterium]|nr:hypothetical protein [Candidatus Hydrogenedentota bacterium]
MLASQEKLYPHHWEDPRRSSRARDWSTMCRASSPQHGVDQSQGMDRHQMGKMPVGLRERMAFGYCQPAVFIQGEIR